MKINSAACVRLIFGTALLFAFLLALDFAGAAPPAQPTDPAAGQWVQDIDQAYANTDTYQSTGTATIDLQSLDTPQEAPQRATVVTQIAWDRPNRQLFLRMDIDTPAKPKGAKGPVVLLVSDGKKLRLRSGMFVGHHLETDIPDPFNFKSISDLVGGVISPAIAIELRLLLDDQALADLAGGIPSPPRLEEAVGKNQDTPGFVNLIFTDVTSQCTIGIDPDHHLVRQIDLEIRMDDSTTTTLYTIEVEKHNQPLDEGLFTFDTTGSKAVETLNELIQSASGGAAAGPAAHPTQGQDAPPIELETLDGQAFKLQDVDASVVILDFWATWCPPCRQGLPLLQKFHDWAQSNDKSVAVYTVNLQETPETVRKYWEQAGFTMPVLMDTQGSVAQAYQVQGIPQTVMIHNGKVADVHVGFSPDLDKTLQAEVERLLNEPPDGD